MTEHEERLPKEKLPDGEPYEVPEDIKGDRGKTLAYVITACYGQHLSPLLEHFDASRQTLFVWRKPGFGIPYSRKDELEQLIADPKQPFRLGTNIELKHIMKPPRKSLEPRVPKWARRNDALLDLLKMLMDTPVLDQMADGYLGLHSSPHILFKWAYSNGGVPTNHLVRVITGMIRTGVPARLGMTVDEFVPYFVESFTANPDEAKSEPLPLFTPEDEEQGA